MCGIAAVMLKPGVDCTDTNALSLVFDALRNLNHRGPLGTGVAYNTVGDSRVMRTYKSSELVGPAFAAMIDRFHGLDQSDMAVGQVRYATEGSRRYEDLQPAIVPSHRGLSFALVSNGNLVNYQALCASAKRRDFVLSSNNEVELMLREIIDRVMESNGLHKSPETLIEAIQWAVGYFQGAFSSILLSKDALYAFMDPRGFRPLVWGENEYIRAIVSEPCALDILDIDHRNRYEIQPGQVIHFARDGKVRTYDAAMKTKPRRHCIFELIYFSRPDSDHWTGEAVHLFRRERLGRLLAQADRSTGLFDHVDLVMPVPDSANSIAQGYALESGLPYEHMALVRNHYVERTFIQPEARQRNDSVRHKFNPMHTVLAGKSVVLVDDSIVRGTTMRKLIFMLVKAGVRAIHVRIGSPPIRFGCHWGIAHKEDALAMTEHGSVETFERYYQEAIRKKFGGEGFTFTLRYLSLDDLLRAAPRDEFCRYCFDGKDPMEE